jgi:hypothetical protein
MNSSIVSVKKAKFPPNSPVKLFCRIENFPSLDFAFWREEARERELRKSYESDMHKACYGVRGAGEQELCLNIFFTNYLGFFYKI